MYYYINVFFVFSIIGHFIESILHPSYESGILIGFWTPVYGFGAVIILIIYKLIKKRIKNTWVRNFILFFISGIILSAMEMLGGYLIEKLFNKVFWNYNNHKFNIGLYASLEMTIVWGIASLIVIYILKPLFDKLVLKIPKIITWILIFLFIVDILYKISTIF